MAIMTRSALAVGLVLFTAACGTATSGPAVRATATHPTVPAVSVTPHTTPAGGRPATAPPAAPDLASSSLLDTSWVSATEGWALAAQPCATGTCARLARTTDAGRHWHVLPGPPAAINAGTTDCSARACVSQVRFAGPAIGYLYGPALLMTTDGGLTWHAQPGPQTETLTIAGGQVYRVSYTSDGCPGPCQPALQEAPAGSASWRTLIEALAEPSRSDSAQIVVTGPDVLVAMYGSQAGPVPAQAVVYRSADGGGTWRQLADPCGGLGPRGREEDLIGLASAPGGFFAGLCSPHTGNGAFVVSSTDRGGSWRTTGTLPKVQALGLLAAASPTSLAVATSGVDGSGPFTAEVLVTADGGRHWVTVAAEPQELTLGSAVPARLGFETPLDGQWLGGPHDVWTTTDGGVHWTRTAFR